MSRLDPDAGRNRRAGDLAPQAPLLRRVVDWSGRHGSPVNTGRGLMLVTGAVITVTVPMFTPDRRAWTVIGAVTLTMTVLLLLTLALPWSRLPGRSTLVFPVSVWVGLAVLGAGAHGLGGPYVGMFVLCFAYVGLTQPPGTSLWLVPPAVVAYVEALGGWSGQLGVRLLIAVSLWTLLGELLAELTRRQTALTQALRRAAHTDVLTGLPNRRDLDLRLMASEPGDTVVLCDMDHFKQLNDTLGHPAGDRVLADFGLLLRSCLREQDYAARYGGEEFAVLLPATSTAQAREVLTRLHQRWAVLQPDVTFSAGLAACDTQSDPATTLATADQALYEAKATGRNRDRDRIVPGRTPTPASPAPTAAA